MLLLAEIREYIAGLGVAEHVYIGKLDNKKDHSVGIYHRKGDGLPVTALGGTECSSYDICRISLLIHWDRDVQASEQAAYGIYEKLRELSEADMGDSHVFFVLPQVPEPVDVGTDDKGIYEYVIWLNFIVRK